MTQSQMSKRREKPAKPRSDFPLFLHATEIVRLLTTDFAVVYKHELLSHWESRALRPGEGLLNLQSSDRFDSFKRALPGRYRVRPSRREGELN